MVGEPIRDRADGRARILVVVGTRPEAIKLAPVVLELARRTDAVSPRVCVTAQHRGLADDVLDWFGIRPDHDLDVMRDGQSLNQVMARVVSGIDSVIATERPDWVVVQGDTATVVAASLAAFTARIPIAHVEAGLRTHDLTDPFPEEANRRMAGVLATLHLAPTDRARQNLVREGVPDRAIVVSGNPGIDALRLGLAALPSRRDDEADTGVRDILVTVHRRESFGPALVGICRALRHLGASRTDIRIILPVHPNPEVSGPVREILGDCPRVCLVAPMRYVELVDALRRSYFVMTDSGGLQEEAPALGKPVLVLRDMTERPEGLEAGAALLVGRTPGSICLAAERLLDDTEAYRAMAVPRWIYGDGSAARRIVDGLLAYPGASAGKAQATTPVAPLP
jgi:UDP-N-acetylglucosamine 2-epimerase (non-hydrolysing)